MASRTQDEMSSLVNSHCELLEENFYKIQGACFQFALSQFQIFT